MNIRKDDANRLRELYEKISDEIEEFKDICRRSMTRHEYDRFKYANLGHLEPTINHEHGWCIDKHAIDPLEKVVEQAEADCTEEEE